ncbi:unnamed protein product [Clavelina lepadiformis]|uniref:Uncharacterized protein n=1 Tax=Clavelina lepadiformis TaxID=159417 RepID=A0ABP0GEP1_CLALP
MSFRHGQHQCLYQVSFLFTLTVSVFPIKMCYGSIILIWLTLYYTLDEKLVIQGLYGNDDHVFIQLNQSHLLKDKQIVKILDLGETIGILTKTGHFYVFATTANCQNVISKDDLILVDEEKKFEMVENKFHESSVYALENGKVVILEKGGQEPLYKFSLPLCVKPLFKQLSCGKDHCLALTTDGKVFSWGIGSRGQLGHGHTNTVEAPQLVETLDGVTIQHISCGGWHSVALAETNDLYTWGWNESGQTGFLAPNKIFTTCTKISPKNTTDPKSKKSGLNCLFPELLSKSPNHHYSENTVCGKGIEFDATELQQGSLCADFNQDADSSSTEAVGMVLEPQLLELEKYLPGQDGFVSIVGVSCGSRHTAAVTSTGQLITWGWGKYGQLGHSCCINSRNSLDRPDDAPRINKRCCKKPNHLPHHVLWFEKQGLAVDGVVCGLWNTFVSVHHRL